MVNKDLGPPAHQRKSGLLRNPYASCQIDLCRMIRASACRNCKARYGSRVDGALARTF